MRGAIFKELLYYFFMVQPLIFGEGVSNNIVSVLITSHIV